MDVGWEITPSLVIPDEVIEFRDREGDLWERRKGLRFGTWQPVHRDWLDHGWFDDQFMEYCPLTVTRVR